MVVCDILLNTESMLTISWQQNQQRQKMNSGSTTSQGNKNRAKFMSWVFLPQIGIQ